MHFAIKLENNEIWASKYETSSQDTGNMKTYDSPSVVNLIYLSETVESIDFFLSVSSRTKRMRFY